MNANIDKFGGDLFDQEKYLFENDFIFLFLTFAKKSLMSEFIKNQERRIRDLYNFISGITTPKEKAADLYQKYREVIASCHPYDAMVAIDLLMKENLELPVVKKGVNRSLNTLYKGIMTHPVPNYQKKPFFNYLNQENNEVLKLLSGLKPFIQKANEKNISEKEFMDSLAKIETGISRLNEFNLHYIKLENILFPYIEKHVEESGCLPLMWSYHDDIRNLIKKTLQVLQEKPVDLKKLNRYIGDLYFVVYAMRFREEHILFPVVLDQIEEEEIEEMANQAYDVGFAFISPKRETHPAGKTNTSLTEKDENVLSLSDWEDKILDFDTGKLTVKQAIIMLNSLPVDMTFVDENDRVLYFSNPKDRIFQRSKAIIGRLVENCHPPSSVHIVKELIEAFRSGKKSKESFWIQMGGKFILIQYFAMRDETGKYCGTLEVSQDVTDIKKLEGEKRLMD